MQAYLRPSGTNGTRFNSRLSKAKKAAWIERKAERKADLLLLERVKEFLSGGRGFAFQPPDLRSKVLLEWRDNAHVCQVFDRSTRRLIGCLPHKGLPQC